MGSLPTPALTVDSPIWLPAGQLASSAAGSGQSSTPESTPETPGGTCRLSVCGSCSPSSRPIDVVSALNAPAWRFAGATASDGANGRLAGHGPPCGPAVI